MKPVRHKSALALVLKALIPYSRESIMLGFKPNAFFNELEHISKYKRSALEQAARRAQERGLIERDKKQRLRLTKLGKLHAQPFIAEKLKDSKLMVIFDVSGDLERNRLRRLLKSWHFQQIQKSVWVCDYDHRANIAEVIKLLDLHESVRIYECSLLAE